MKNFVSEVTRVRSWSARSLALDEVPRQADRIVRPQLRADVLQGGQAAVDVLVGDQHRRLEPQRLRIAQRRRDADAVHVEEIAHQHEDEIVLIGEQPQQEARIVQQAPELDADHQAAAADVDDDVGVGGHQAAAVRSAAGPPCGGTRRAPPASSSSSALSDTPLE